MKPADLPAGPELKQCCANLYESDAARLLLGESFHPGGLKLTERLGSVLQLGPHSRVLDVACGRGASALFLAERFGCEVIGIDYGVQHIAQARADAAKRNFAERVRFEQADAEELPFPDASFDAVVCECAFCTFPDKSKAAREFARVLAGGGRIGISDLTRSAELPRELEGLLAWIACIADAQPAGNYVEWFRSAGFVPELTEPHDAALVEIVRQVQAKLMGVEVMKGLNKIQIPEIDFTAARQMAKAALTGVQQGQLGYAIISARKP